MTKKIFRAIMAVAMTVLVLGLFITSSFLYDYFNKLQVRRLKDALSLARAGVEQAELSFFEDFHSEEFRFTLISSEGEVLYDSRAVSGEMDNHMEREEIAEAMQKGSGSSVRYSSTLTERTFYEAVRLRDGRILRVSTTQMTIATLMIGMLPAIFLILLFSVATAIGLSGRMSKSIVRPLETLDLEHPEHNDTYEELTPVLSRLNRQHGQIARQMQELKQRDDEFRLIMSSMKEGLVLLDKRGLVLRMNQSARNLFSVNESVTGRDFLLYDRSKDMTGAVQKAFSGCHSEFRQQRENKEYQFMVTPTQSEGEIVGVVILCIDVTEAAFAERSRKEFTANVSHELKTPLQGIIGSAELLENGLVREEDKSRFIGNIKREAARLVALINDIIRLSQLDEKKELPMEMEDLYEVAEEAVAALNMAAAERGISISLNGKSCLIYGVRRYLYEIIYNLCDNAIRYNREGGKVEITVKKEKGQGYLEVRDNGIGIPKEQQSRIFERFYRVDKSHSKETGGTGLGLSIVKHSAACHDGTVRLESKEGEGTVVTVILPEQKVPKTSCDP